MNRTIQTTILLLLIGAVLPGCATQRVRVNAYRSQELPFPAVDAEPPATIKVVVGTEPDEPLLEAEIARKVEHLVRDVGYTVSRRDDSDYILTCWVSIDENPNDWVYDYRCTQPQYATSYVYCSPSDWTAVSYGYSSYAYPLSNNYRFYTRFLDLTLYERTRWTDASEDEVGKAAVWSCTASNTGSSSDLRTISNYLLAAAFEYFGLDTSREIHIRLPADDPRVAEIMQSAQPPNNDD